jgi:hypothetical protein
MMKKRWIINLKNLVSCMVLILMLVCLNACQKEEIDPKTDMYMDDIIYHLFYEDEETEVDVHIIDISVLLFKTDRMRQDVLEEGTQIFVWVYFKLDGREHSITVQAEEITYGETVTFEIENLYDGKTAYNNSKDRIKSYTESELSNLGIVSFSRSEMNLSDKDIKHYHDLAKDLIDEN